MRDDPLTRARNHQPRIFESVFLGNLSDPSASFMHSKEFKLGSTWSAEAELRLLGGIRIRPIRPEDAALYRDFASHVTMDDRRRRFFGRGPDLTPAALARLTQIDHQREMAFVAIDEKVPALLGVGRMICDAEVVDAEFAILVRSDLQGRGLGSALMSQLVSYGHATGLTQLHGSVLAENGNMLRLARKVGFEITNGTDPGVLRLSLAYPTHPKAPSSASVS